MEASSEDILTFVRPELHHPSYFLAPPFTPYSTSAISSLITKATAFITTMATNMNASDLERVDATVARLDTTLKAFKAYFGCSTWYSYLQEQALLLRVHEAEIQLDKIRMPLNSLRAWLAQSVTSTNAAATAGGKEAAAKQMMAKAEKMMVDAGKKMETAYRKEREAGMMFAEINGLMKAAQIVNADAQSRINTAVGLQDQADEALITLQQNIARCNEHSTTTAVETMRQVFVLQKLQKSKMEAEISERLETNRVRTIDLEGDYTTQLLKNNNVFREIMINKWNEVRKKLLRARNVFMTGQHRISRTFP